MNHTISLINNHRRRLNILEKNLALVGASSSGTTLEIEIQDIKDTISNLENQLKRRLQSRKEQLALYGISADPSISIEIEDIEEYFQTYRVDNDQKQEKYI